MKKLNRLTFLLSLVLFSCSADDEPGTTEQKGGQLEPTIWVKAHDGTPQTRTVGTSSTFFKNGESVGFLLLNQAKNALYSDTKGIVRYIWDGTYWSTFDGYVMTDENTEVFCFHPYGENESNAYDGLNPSFRPLDTATNTDYLWGVVHDNFRGKVNGNTPQVSMVMDHVLARVSFRLQRGIPFVPGSTVSKGSCTKFEVTTLGAGGKSMRGKMKYSIQDGTVNQSGAVYDNKACMFTSIQGKTLGQDMNDVIGNVGKSIVNSAGVDGNPFLEHDGKTYVVDCGEFMSFIPGNGTMTVNLTVDGQDYIVSLPAHDYKAGHRYIWTLVYKGSEVDYVKDGGHGDGYMDIAPWISGGNIGVKAFK